LLVEGGTQTLNLFIQSGLWDEARVFISPVKFQEGLEAPVMNGTADSLRPLAGDTLKVYHNRTPKPTPLK